MTEQAESNGQAAAAPEPLLAGHLVIYEDAIAFRADGSESVIVRAAMPQMVQALSEVLSEGDGGILAKVLAGDIRAALGSIPGGPLAMARAIAGIGGS